MWLLLRLTWAHFIECTCYILISYLFIHFFHYIIIKVPLSEVKIPLQLPLVVWTHIVGPNGIQTIRILVLVRVYARGTYVPSPKVPATYSYIILYTINVCIHVLHSKRQLIENRYILCIFDNIIRHEEISGISGFHYDTTSWKYTY